MNFLFVDKIIALEPGKSSLALKHITASDTYLMQTNPNRIALLPCIIGEALGQLCSWNVIKTSDFTLRMVGGIVDEVRIHDNAFLGETLILENNIDRLDLEERVAHFHGTARVGNRLILEVKNGLGPLLPLEDFSDVAKVKKEYQFLYSPQHDHHYTNPTNTIETFYLQTPEIYSQPLSFQEGANPRALLAYDHILQWEKGKHLVAQKNLSLTAPYFADHFPLRPVFPLSLLIESILQLAYPFINGFLANSKAIINPIAVRKIKMNDFITPGTVLISKLVCKEIAADKIILTFRSEVNAKRVCVGEAEFTVRYL